MYRRVLFALACASHAMMCAFHIARAVRAFFGVCCVLPCGPCFMCCVFYVYVFYVLPLRSCYIVSILDFSWNRFCVYNEIYDVLSPNQRDGYGAPLVYPWKVNFLQTVFAIVTSNAGRTALAFTLHREQKCTCPLGRCWGRLLTSAFRCISGQPI